MYNGIQCRQRQIKKFSEHPLDTLHSLASLKSQGSKDPSHSGESYTDIEILLHVVIQVKFLFQKLESWAKLLAT